MSPVGGLTYKKDGSALFKFYDKHPRLFHMGVFPPAPHPPGAKRSDLRIYKKTTVKSNYKCGTCESDA